VKELVIISGKGGTGKTSIAASFAALADNAVFADCDVDAADLHLILDPSVRSLTEFSSGHEAVIRGDDCTACGECFDVCRFDAVIKSESDGEPYRVDPLSCEGCGVCVWSCPVGAIDFPECVCGEWYVSDTRFGPMVHARLGIAAENSGKLVSIVREQAKKLAAGQNRELILVDGPPGIGCPVIASITGSDAVVVITEPTLSGGHDLDRVMELANHFKIPAYVCINKWDINAGMAEKIEENAAARGGIVVGRIPYDKEVTTAQIQGKSVVEHGTGPAVKAINAIWEQLKSDLLNDELAGP
jgi:MinD superfamily P-loop ATPase